MKELLVHKNLEAFVKDIFLLESDEENSLNKIPFYADGFPGIIYSQSTNHFKLMPRNKELSEFYLYGQTIEPISLDVTGSYKLVCMRMYPFAARILLGVDPKVLNDDCFNLKLIEGVNTQNTLNLLNKSTTESESVNILADYFNELLENASHNPDYRIKLAINLILNNNGSISIKDIRDKLHVTERTLERHFLKEIGVTAKQFAKIIQFSSSLKQITDDDYLNLTEIGFENGFADQSHFIRSFKRFTGKTPKEFQKQISV